MVVAAASPSVRTKLSVVLAATKMRLLNASRYPGMLIMDVITPIVIASLPILMGRATAGENAARIFAENTGTVNYVGYMMVGGATFMIVSTAFWHIAFWMRWEMETGTIEALYMVPVNRIWIAAGVALYSLIRSFGSGVVAYFIGSFILGANPFQGEMLLALAFILVGIIPLYGLTLLFGAVVLKLKEANALIQLMQWVVSFLMGVFFPLAVLPPLARYLAMLFPPTWMTNGVRAALFGIEYLFGEWYLDLAVLGVFVVITPLIGAWVFAKVEGNIRRHEGVGQF